MKIAAVTPPGGRARRPTSATWAGGAGPSGAGFWSGSIQAPGCAGFTAHTLRHTAATWLRQSTGDARLVAEYLGHADLSTVNRYTHVAADELRAGAEAIAAVALPVPSPSAPPAGAGPSARLERAA